MGGLRIVLVAGIAAASSSSILVACMPPHQNGQHRVPYGAEYAHDEPAVTSDADAAAPVVGAARLSAMPLSVRGRLP